MDVYRHSGSVPLGGFLQTFLISSAAAVVGGTAYAFATYYLPFVYLNLLLTLGFGMALGALTGALVRRGRIRNTFVAGILGLGAGLAALYASWIGTVLALGLGEGLATADPWRIAAVMRLLYLVGYWEVGGDTVKGTALAAVWLIEAGTITFLATRTATAAVSQLPFCERCGRWTSVEEGVRYLLLRPEDECAVERAAAGQLAALAEMERLGDEGGDHVQLDLATCPSCDDSNFLTIKTIRLSLDRKGQVQGAALTLLRHGQIGPSEAALVRDAGYDRPEPPADAEAESDSPAS